MTKKLTIITFFIVSLVVISWSAGLVAEEEAKEKKQKPRTRIMFFPLEHANAQNLSKIIQEFVHPCRLERNQSAPARDPKPVRADRQPAVTLQ